MKVKDILITILVAIAFVVVLGFSWHFMDRMVDVLKCGNRIQNISLNTNDVHRSSLTSNSQGIDNKEAEGRLSVVAAYDSLCNELSTWMSIMGIFAAIFGLLIPLGSYLLQRQSLKDERENIFNDIIQMRDKYTQLDKVEGRLKEIEQQFENMESAVKGTSTSFWKAMGRCFEYGVITNKYAKEHIILSGCAEIANLILSMELNFDCCVLAHDSEGLEQQIKYAKMIIGPLNKYHVGELNEAYKLVAQNGQQRTMLVAGVKYLELLGSDNGLYKWLKSFFGKFDTRKLP